MAAPPKIPIPNLKLCHLVIQRSAINCVLLDNKHLLKESYEHHSGNFMLRGGMTSSILYRNWYCTDENCDQIFIRYVSPPPIYEQFCSSFRFIYFIHWTVKNLRYQQKIFKKWKTGCISTKFVHFWDSMKNWSSFYWSKGNSYWTVSLYGVRRTWQKYLWNFLHKNLFLMVGLTDQPDYSICHLMVTVFISTVYPFCTRSSCFWSICHPYFWLLHETHSCPDQDSNI